MALDPAAAKKTAQEIVTALKVPSEGAAAAAENWRSVIEIIYRSIQQNAVVLPTGLLAPIGPGGAPVTGVGSVQ